MAILFQGTEFFINLDKVVNPDLGSFLEVKSRTWSQRDAEHKAQLTTELIRSWGASRGDCSPGLYRDR